VSSVRRVLVTAVSGFAALWSAGCGPVTPIDAREPDAGSPGLADTGRLVDAGASSDAESRDAGSTDAAARPDAGQPIDAGAPVTAPCVLDGDQLTCEYTTFDVEVSDPVPLRRVVHVGLPNGTPPARGWPTVFLFQGSLFSARLSWTARRDDPLGAFAQASTVESLLAAGFAVLTPEVRLFGVTYWDTNVPQWALFWSSSPDHHFMLELLEGVEAGTFGPLDGERLYAGGISSGGYMTSRMALSYPGRFRALAVVAGSWATCAGPVCVLPETLPADHPPTLFLHGEEDPVVPIRTMRRYEEALRAQGTETRVVVDPTARHQFIDAAATEVRDFFLAR
jgi:pimeloyl-ACP methyl ester carboxylesterase